MMAKKISRRDFLVKSAVGTVGLASIGVLSACGNTAATTPEASQTAAPAVTAAPANELQWDYEADVVVLGAGGAGLPAALKAMEDGSSVIVVEANWDVGGHASVSGGNLHSGGGTSFQTAHGVEDHPDWVYADHTTGEIVTARYSDREYVRAVADNMVDAYEFVLSNGVLQDDLDPTKHDSYLEGGQEPERVPRQTKTNAIQEDWVSYNVGIAPSESGSTNSGIGLTRPLERSVRENGGQFLLNYHMDKIYREEGTSGRVLGIQASYKPTILPGESNRLESLWSNGNIDCTLDNVNVKANKAVIICTGGFTGNVNFRTMFDPRMTEEYDGLSGEPFSAQDASGELAALAIGASMGTLANQTQGYYGHELAHPGNLGCRYGYANLTWFKTSPLFKLAGATGLRVKKFDGMVLVNMLGQRFWKEDDSLAGSYSVDTNKYLNHALSSVLIDDESVDGDARRLGGPIWGIFDADEVERNGWTLEQGDVDIEDGRFFSGDTIEELASNIVNKYYEDIKMEPSVLAETIRKYNGYVDAGTDEEFGKESLVYKIEKGPFYAAWATPLCHDCCSGLRVNGKMQVKDLYGDVIPGLYAAGESSAGMKVHGLGRVITSGYIAGMSAAQVG